MKLLGIDNVFFEVGNIEDAIEFYEQLGFQLKFKIPHMNGALLNIGDEVPGLGIRQVDIVNSSHLWVEVSDVRDAQKLCASLNIEGNMIEPPTGFTFEITDLWGNKI